MVKAYSKCSRHATLMVVTLIIMADKGDINRDVGYNIKQKFQQ